MTNTDNLSIFEIKHQYNELHQLATEFLHESSSLYSEYELELIKIEMKINSSLLSFQFSNFPELLDRFKKFKPITDDERRIVESIKVYDHYSHNNVFVWLKRYYKRYSSITKELSNMSKCSAELLSNVKALVDQAKKYQHKQQIQDIMTSLDTIRVKLLEVKNYNIKMYNGHATIENVFANIKSISKTDFLSLMTLRKDAYTVDQIASLPEQLKIEDYTEAIFMNGIEDDSCNYMQDFLFEYIMKARAENRELARKMDEHLGLDMIPSFSVGFDEYGEVGEIKQNKPVFHVVD